MVAAALRLCKDQHFNGHPAPAPFAMACGKLGSSEGDCGSSTHMFCDFSHYAKALQTSHLQRRPTFLHHTPRLTYMHAVRVEGVHCGAGTSTLASYGELVLNESSAMAAFLSAEVPLFLDTWRSSFSM